MNLPLLMYHSVSERVAPKFRRWAIPPALFEAHIAYLKQNGYVPLTVTEIARAVKDPSVTLPKRVVGITFDDGFEDFYLHALPILARYNFPATLYIASGYVGSTSRWLADEGEGKRQMLNWQQIRVIADQGIEIGAHSLFHYELDTLDLFEAEKEISGSKALLEQHLVREVDTFAYPHGYYSREVRELVRQVGFSSACAVKHRISSRRDDPYALARIIIPGDAGVETFANLLKGKGLERVRRHEPAATTLWRLVRKTIKLVRGSTPGAWGTKGGDPYYGKRENRG